MFPEYDEDIFISLNLISYWCLVDLNMISYNIYAQLVYSNAGEYSQSLYTCSFLLTFWLKLNSTLLHTQLLIILLQCQIFDSNSYYKADNNNNFIKRRQKKARYISLTTKAVAIYVKKKLAIIAKIMTWVINRCLLG